MWIRLHKAGDWVWVRIHGKCNMILITNQRCWENSVFLGCFGHFGALFRIPGVTDVRCGLPGFGWDCIKQEIGSG